MIGVDPIYIIFSLPAILLAIAAQILVRYFYSKYSRIPNSADVTGIDIVEGISRNHGLNIRLAVSMSDLSDHYNPISSELTLSEKVAHTPSIASVGIAAHEMGHVLQHKKGALLINIRNIMVPVVNFSTTLGYILFIAGMSLQILGVVLLGVGLFSISTFFTLITLPIEIDASMKALRMIRSLGIFNVSELDDIKKVLFTAALTYVAAVFQSLSSLIYYLLRAFGVRRK